MSRTLFLVRHTQVAIAPGICYGKTDADLAPTYLEEWQHIRKKLAHTFFQQTYTSPLKRCQLLGRYLQPEAVNDSRLEEMNFGLWEGKSWNDIYASEDGKAWFADYLTVRCPGGEAYTDVFARVSSFAAQVRQAKGNTLIVTHAGVIRAMLELFCGINRANLFSNTIQYGQIISITGKTTHFYE